MGERKMPKSLEAIMMEKQKAEAELTYWTHKEKILRHQIKDLTRKERTHMKPNRKNWKLRSSVCRKKSKYRKHRFNTLRSLFRRQASMLASRSLPCMSFMN